MKADYKAIKGFNPKLRIGMHQLTGHIRIYPGYYQLPRLTNMLYNQLNEEFLAFWNYTAVLLSCLATVLNPDTLPAMYRELLSKYNDLLVLHSATLQFQHQIWFNVMLKAVLHM